MTTRLLTAAVLGIIVAVVRLLEDALHTVCDSALGHRP